MGVTRHDRVDVVVRVQHDLAEPRVRIGRRGDVCSSCSLMHEKDHDVRLAVARVSITQLIGDTVRRLDRASDGDVLNAGRTHQRRKFVGDSANESDPHGLLLLCDLSDPVLRKCRVARGLVIDVRAEVLPVRERHDAFGEIGEAGVELVVAHGAHVEPGGIQRLDRRHILLDEGREGRGADHVTRGGENRRPFGTKTVHGCREPGDASGRSGLLDAPVEIVDGYQVEVDHPPIRVAWRGTRGRRLGGDQAAERREPGRRRRRARLRRDACGWGTGTGRGVTEIA